MKISIHALREEGDAAHYFTMSCHCNFYPRPPRGGRLFLYGKLPNKENISIHALREEGDGGAPPPLFYFKDFYPRPPRGGRR